MRKVVLGLMMGCLLGHPAIADVWEDLATYTYGSSPNTAEIAFGLLDGTSADQQAAIEDKLIAVVSNTDATQDGKAFACRMLQRIGTEKCIPAVSAMLEDTVLSHYARLVLERMEGSGKAAAALRAALTRAPGEVQVGILGSIGEGRDEPSVEQALALARGADPAVASAAMMALGKIGNRQAAEGLAKLQVGEPLKPAHMDALVACADRLGGAGAAALYNQVLAGKRDAHRVAAMRGLAATDPKAGAGLIAEALTGDDPKLRQGALGAVMSVKGEALTHAVTAVLDDLPSDRKAELLVALGSRGDRTALGAVTRHTKDQEAVVRDAAIGALGRLGNAATVNVLLDLAASGEVQGPVKEALTRMQDADTNEALLRALTSHESKAMVIEALVARNCTSAVPRLMDMLKSGDPGVRETAWTGLGALGGARDIEAVVGAIVQIKDDKELPAARDAVKRIFATASDKNACFATIAGSYDTAPSPIKPVFLELGAAAGSAEALELARKALKSKDKDLRKAAVRALASWANVTAADDLYGLATSAEDEVDRILGLRGYIGMAGTDRVQMATAQRVEMFRKAAGLVKRTDEKRLIISGLPLARSTQGLGMLEAYMDDPDVKREAELAGANLLWEMRSQKSPEAEKFARRLLESEDKGVREKTAAVVADWSKYQCYVTTWSIAGPLTEEGKSAQDLFNKAFAAETDGKGVTWSTLEKGIDREIINLQAQLGNRDNCCAYVKTVLDSPSDQSARLEMGSDDAIKAWLNGELVHQNFAHRGCTPGQDAITVALKKGRNTLMLKIVDAGGDWAFSCRLRNESGMPVDGLKALAE